jgi:hypothetical protein
MADTSDMQPKPTTPKTRPVLRLLVDTCVWLDLAKDLHGQALIGDGLRRYSGRRNSVLLLFNGFCYARPSVANDRAHGPRRCRRRLLRGRSGGQARQPTSRFAFLTAPSVRSWSSTGTRSASRADRICLNGARRHGGANPCYGLHAPMGQHVKFKIGEVGIFDVTALPDLVAAT